MHAPLLLRLCLLHFPRKLQSVGGADSSHPPNPHSSQVGKDEQPIPNITRPWLLPPWSPPPADFANSPDLEASETPVGDNFPEDVLVCQLRISSMLSVQIHIDGKPFKAVVDTAAEVTFLSDRIHQTLHHKPPVIKHVVLNTAGREIKMKGLIVGPVAMTLGEYTLNEVVYIAPIDDDMLLGVDLLRKYNATINIPRATLSFQGNEGVSIAQVFVKHSVALPPFVCEESNLYARSVFGTVYH